MSGFGSSLPNNNFDKQLQNYSLLQASQSARIALQLTTHSLGIYDFHQDLLLTWPSRVSLSKMSATACVSSKKIKH